MLDDCMKAFEEDHGPCSWVGGQDGTGSTPQASVARAAARRLASEAEGPVQGGRGGREVGVHVLNPVGCAGPCGWRRYYDVRLELYGLFFRFVVAGR